MDCGGVLEGGIMIELTIINKASGRGWNVMPQDITHTTHRTGSPGTLKFTINKAGTLSFTEGDEVRFSIDGQLQFSGWVFTKVKDRWGVIEVTCYDRLRYFKANASYAFYGVSAGDIIRKIAGDLKIPVGSIVDTGYLLPSYIQEDKSCMDIIGEAIQKTLLNTGTIFVFYDDGNGACLSRAEDMIAPYVIGEKSLLLDYSYKTDIDEQTYNSIKLSRPNQNTGRADTFVAQDSSTIGQWGLLQLYQTVDEAMNDAQVKAQAAASLEYYNRRLRTLSITSLGVPLRAGQMILMKIPDLGDIALDQYALVEQVTHTFQYSDTLKGYDHEMSVELRGF